MVFPSKKTFLFIAVVLFICSALYYYVYNGIKIEGMMDQGDPYPNIDIVYYINLDHREDRKNELLEELDHYQFPEHKIQRIPAIYKKTQGHLGCSMSHINALNQFIQSNHNTCLILEDDFQFSENVDIVQDYFRKVATEKVDFDVIMLAAATTGNNVLDTEYPYLKKTKYATTASGYFVNRKIATILLQNFKDGEKLLRQSYEQNYGKDGYNGSYAVDQYWFPLQEKYKWYSFFPKLGKQRKSYSDIQKGNVDYNL